MSDLGIPRLVQGRFFMSLGSHLGGLRTSLFIENRSMDFRFTVDVYGMTSGIVFDKILIVQGGLDA